MHPSGCQRADDKNPDKAAHRATRVEIEFNTEEGRAAFWKAICDFLQDDAPKGAEVKLSIEKPNVKVAGKTAHWCTSRGPGAGRDVLEWRAAISWTSAAAFGT